METVLSSKKMLVCIVTILVLVLAGQCYCGIDTVTGPTFNLTAKDGYINTPDGGSYLMWGFALGDDTTTAGTDPNIVMQYTGPNLEVDQGDIVVVTLRNHLDVPVSIVFPGQADVDATGGLQGLLTREASPGGGTVTYTFEATEPGTYLYHSGTEPQLQTEMGLVGALIIRPTGYNAISNKIAYSHNDSLYDYEYIFIHTEMDPTIHQLVEYGRVDEIDFTTYSPVYWFYNGRNFPDTILTAANSELLPHQPYNCLPRMHPGDLVLMRVIGAGRDAHPFHTHSNNFTSIARDGRLLESTPGAGADLAYSRYTLTIEPGTTRDAIFEWTGKGLGWDIYGHDANDSTEPGEYMPDHGKPIPVILPPQKDLTFGLLYSGSPYLGSADDLPPGQGGLNATNGYFQIWHSHHEKEVCNNDIFPGGQITFMLIDHPDVNIP